MILLRLLMNLGMIDYGFLNLWWVILLPLRSVAYHKLFALSFKILFISSWWASRYKFSARFLSIISVFVSKYVALLYTLFILLCWVATTKEIIGYGKVDWTRVGYNFCLSAQFRSQNFSNIGNKAFEQFILSSIIWCIYLMSCSNQKLYLRRCICRLCNLLKHLLVSFCWLKWYSFFIFSRYHIYIFLFLLQSSGRSCARFCNCWWLFERCHLLVVCIWHMKGSLWNVWFIWNERFIVRMLHRVQWTK